MTATSRRLSRLRMLAVPTVVVVCWQALHTAGLVDYDYLPAPGEVFAALIELTRSGEVFRDLAHTLGVAAVATGLAMLVGAVVGFALGLVAAVRRYAMASVDFLRTVPAVALVPVAVLTFGPLPSTEVLLAVYAATWPIVLHTAAGAASVPARQYDVARMLHFDMPTKLRKIVVPNVIPAWLVGARLSVVVALLVAVMAEMIMYLRGLGGGLIESMQALAPARMWAYALVCGVVGAGLNGGLRYLVRRALPGYAARGEHVRATPPQFRGLLPIGLLLIGWQLAASEDSLSFPPPSAWLAALARMHADGLLVPAVLHTLGTYAFGLACAVAFGTALGVAIGRSETLDRYLTPTLDFVAAIPGAALVPVAVLLLGQSMLSGIAVVAVIVSWPILLNATAAMRAIPVVRLEMSRTLGLSPRQRWISVILPSLAQGVVLGITVASSLAVIIALLVDILGAGTGIGRLLVESQQHFDAAAAWALLLIVGSFGYLMSTALSRLRGAVTVTEGAAVR